MQDIHAIRPPVAAGIDPVLLWLIPAIVLGIAALVLAGIFLKRRLKNRAAPRPDKAVLPQIPPYQTAMAALRQMKADRVTDARQFYFELTLVLRQYLDGSFNCRTCEMTSQEFVRVLSFPELGKELKQQVIRFVNASDPIKYGGDMPSADQVKEDIERVIGFVEKIEARRNETRPVPGEQG